ncbi:uncharacterized protein LOC124922026 [Impatiens glandulifera]|uniref:uncharacterized protein LOC124922026 n=1 Tax=Impatiens glandulifera TaxID=253017 RepID=UPI001FB15CDE|nr:uncharacterized protein LOC124922026 [Impatiens glandulifera]
MVEFKALLLSNRNVLFSFFTSVLGYSRNNLLLPETIGERFEKSKKNQIMHFIVGFALTLPSFALLNILSLVKGVNGQLLHVKDVKILASMLLKKRREYHIQHAESCQKLSKTEVYILCLLLRLVLNLYLLHLVNVKTYYWRCCSRVSQPLKFQLFCCLSSLS